MTTLTVQDLIVDNNFTLTGSSQADIAMNSNLITGLSDPNNAQDAATKNYVDGEITSLIDSAPALLNTLNELAEALGDDENFSATVTTSIATKLALAGGTMSGVIAMGDNKITGLADPENAQDAVTLSHLDSELTSLYDSLSNTIDIGSYFKHDGTQEMSGDFDMGGFAFKKVDLTLSGNQGGSDGLSNLANDAAVASADYKLYHNFTDGTVHRWRFVSTGTDDNIFQLQYNEGNTESADWRQICKYSA